jgi:nitrogen fixation NifU-like protein
MPGLDDLYREIILDHYRSPRNRGELPPPAAHAIGHNPLCGDEIDVYLEVVDGPDGPVVADIKVGGQGCSISQSSASMMSQAVKGKPVSQVRAMVQRFEEMLGIRHDDAGDDASTDRAGGTAANVQLGDIEALQGVAKFPVRIKCATLAWYTLVDALAMSADATAG